MLAEDIRHPEKQPKSSKGGRKKYKRQKKGTKEGGTEFRPGKGVLKREKFPGSSCTDHVTDHAGVTWLSFTDHVADHTLIM